MTVTISKLTEDTLPSAIILVETCFANIVKSTGLPVRSLRASLDPSVTAGHADMQGILSRDYWVLHDNQMVCGVVGLMEFDDDDADTDWVNWFCVDPDHRGKGYGRDLLQKIINESTARGKSTLKLWTTDSQNEESAQFLYEKMGFTVTNTEPYSEAGNATVKIYRERCLKK